MADVDFSDIEAATSWFKTQSREKRCVLVSRAALRVAGCVGLFEGRSGALRTLLTLRAVLTTYAYSVTQSADVQKRFSTIARSTAFAADSAMHAVPSPDPNFDISFSPEALTHSAASEAARAAISAVETATYGTVEDTHLSADSAAFNGRYSNSAIIAICYRDRVKSKGVVPKAAGYLAIQIDSKFAADHLVALPLWSGGNVPEPLFLAHGQFMQSLYGHPDWAFWANWYRGMWDGTFRNWELATEVALLPDEVWDGKDAVANVAAAIREIEAKREEAFDRPDNVPELQRQKLLEHVRRLLAAPDMAALAAEGAADTLERAIAQYLKEAPANCLPDALEHLQDVPQLFRWIATTVKSAEQADAKETKLAKDIKALNAKIARLEADLRDARAKTVHGLFTQSALKAAGTAFGAGLVGSLGLAVSHFFGEWPSDLTLENFRGWTSDLGAAEPKPEAATLPPSYEA
ncbi:hypothetical protein [uncultured Tateyamaria sp.]|nr:hypothetical protein [uncultured Tateyamaria sp.]